MKRTSDEALQESRLSSRYELQFFFYDSLERLLFLLDEPSVTLPYASWPSVEVASECTAPKRRRITTSRVLFIECSEDAAMFLYGAAQLIVIGY